MGICACLLVFATSAFAEVDWLRQVGRGSPGDVVDLAATPDGGCVVVGDYFGATTFGNDVLTGWGGRGGTGNLTDATACDVLPPLT